MGSLEEAAGPLRAVKSGGGGHCQAAAEAQQQQQPQPQQQQLPQSQQATSGARPQANGQPDSGAPLALAKQLNLGALINVMMMNKLPGAPFAASNGRPDGRTDERLTAPPLKPGQPQATQQQQQQQQQQARTAQQSLVAAGAATNAHYWAQQPPLSEVSRSGGDGGAPDSGRQSERARVMNIDVSRRWPNIVVAISSQIDFKSPAP
jgi:hypothetical protein